MWWPNLRRASAAAVLLVALLGLGACQVRPLYSPAAGESGPLADLPAIKVDQALTREEQVYRNTLLFELGSGDAPARYNLIYRLTLREQPILIERGSGVANAYQLTGGVSFLLKEAATGTSIFGASVSGADTYSRSSQNFANIRARRDAEDRLAKALAELTRARLSAYFATH